MRSKVSFLATDCARARESVSIQLDGELPELELDRLDTHLRFCPECEAWAEQVRSVTQRLREATLEAPAERFVLPRRGRRWAVGSAVALASAAAVVATMFVTPGGHQAPAGLRSSDVILRTSGQRVMTPRLTRLEDGRFAALSSVDAAEVFRPV
jgi:anti-sigma factor RsiW